GSRGPRRRVADVRGSRHSSHRNASRRAFVSENMPDEPARVEVGGRNPYPVVVGRGLLADIVSGLGQARTVAIFHQPTITETAEVLRAELAEAGIDAHRIEIPD